MVVRISWEWTWEPLWVDGLVTRVFPASFQVSLKEMTITPDGSGGGFTPARHGSRAGGLPISGPHSGDPLGGEGVAGRKLAQRHQQGDDRIPLRQCQVNDGRRALPQVVQSAATTTKNNKTL